MVFFGSTPCLCVLHSEKPHRSWCLKAMFCCILYWRLNDLEEVNECSFNLEHRKKFDFMVFLCKKQYTLNLDRKMYGNCKTFHENVCRKFNFTFSTNILLTFLTERKCWFFFFHSILTWVTHSTGRNFLVVWSVIRSMNAHTSCFRSYTLATF